MKVAVSIPDPVFKAADELAKGLRISRSELYADALAAYLDARGAHEVREKLDAVYVAQGGRLDAVWSRAQSAVLDDEAW